MKYDSVDLEIFLFLLFSSVAVFCSLLSLFAHESSLLFFVTTTASAVMLLSTTNRLKADTERMDREIEELEATIARLERERDGE